MIVLSGQFRTNDLDVNGTFMATTIIGEGSGITGINGGNLVSSTGGLGYSCNVENTDERMLSV